MRILFIEDEVELNAIATGQLERQGHEVVSLSNLAEAEALLEREGPSFDCLITDHRLPDGFGIAFCVQCRVRHPHLLLGVVSGCLKRQDYELMAEYKVPYWVKPVLYSQVAAEIETRSAEIQSEVTPMEKMLTAPVLTAGKTRWGASFAGLWDRLKGS